MTPSPLFRVKICGVRLKADVDAVAAAGADAVGLNFYAPSIRHVDADTAAELAARGRDRGLHCVGVFVNEAVDTILQTVEAVGLQSVQLHGDESIEVARRLRDRGMCVIRAIKLPTGRLDQATIAAAVEPWIPLAHTLLLDADAGAAHGGSGTPLDWPTLRQWAAQNRDVRWVLAGGLNVANVGPAIAQSGATGVDVASGSESPRGTKSATKIAQFTESAISAFALAGG